VFFTYVQYCPFVLFTMISANDYTFSATYYFGVPALGGQLRFPKALGFSVFFLSNTHVHVDTHFLILLLIHIRSRFLFKPATLLAIIDRFIMFFGGKVSRYPVPKRLPFLNKSGDFSLAKLFSFHI